MPKKYKAKYSGKVFNTKEEAAKDNARYLKDVRYRYLVKGDNLGHPLEYAIPFINDKRITLSNAGLATGAVLSENMLDSIAKYATLAGLPIKTAIGLAVKESTLGNPTDDTSVYQLLSPENEAQFRKWGTGQHINTEGLDMLPRNLLNFYVDERNTYEATQDYVDKKAKGNEDKALLMLIEGEKYADKLALNYADTYANNNVMYNAFKFYKLHPDSYNPKLSNYQLLVNRRANETWKSPEIQSWYLNYQNTHEDGGPLHPDWNELSMKDRAAYIRMGVANGYKNIEDIINVYNEFRKGGAKLNPRESYIYEELPTLLKDAGLNVRVTSGYRPVGTVGTAGARSWHPRHGAVDIVPQGDTTFEDIENVLHNHPVVRQYMLSHNLGLLDESGRTLESKETMRRTGATGAHFHIGKDSKPAAAYRLRVGALLSTDDNKVVYFTNPFLPLEQPIENNNIVVDNTPIVPLPVNEAAILSANPYEEEITYEKTLPEVVVRPEPKIINPLAVYEDMLALAPALTPIETPTIPSITEKVTALSNARNAFLQNELENSIMRSQLIDDDFSREKLRRDIEDLRFYRNMSAYGGNLFPIGGPIITVNPGDRVSTDNCAEWSNGLLRDNGYLISGNAWGLNHVDPVFNGFEGLTRPENYNLELVKAYNHLATDNVFKNFDSKTLDVTKPYVVNMYYNNSEALESAYNDGRGVTGTHTGVLTYDEPTKKWWVTHNIHGNIHQEPFIDLLNSKGKYGVTAIYEPRKRTAWNRLKGFFGFANGGPLVEAANKFNTGGAANIFRRPDGTYFYQASPDSEEITVTPQILLGDNPAYWTYADESGKLYTPQQLLSTYQGEITQGEEPSTWLNILAASNKNYSNPILGAPARWLASWNNNTNAVKALWDSPFVFANPYVLGAKTISNLASEEGIPKTIRLYKASDGSDNARWLWLRSLAGDLLESTMLAPALAEGYKTAKPVFNTAKTYLQNEYPALFDPYTSWDATLGYHGDNIFSRAVGTWSRKRNWTPKAEVPEFHRRLRIDNPDEMLLDENGNMIVSSGRTGSGHDNITNFATSEPARGHSKHKGLSGIDDYIINPKAIGDVDWKSIQPSDTFFESGQLSINPKDITLVSGNTEMLDYARGLGMRTLSSPRLRQHYSLNHAPIENTGIFNRFEGIKSGGAVSPGTVGNEIQRLTSMRGAPTMLDYSYFEDITGLNSGVTPASIWDGTREHGLELFGNWGKVRQSPTFNNVAYAPASSIESIYRGAKMGERPWSDYYAALERMPSARQQLGLNSPMDTYLGEAQVPENYSSIAPNIRTKVGDVIVDDPNTLYHLDRGNNAGAFSNQGAYVQDGMLFPGTPKDAAATPYSWWNLGKPYATSVWEKGGESPLTRMMISSTEAPGMLQVRALNYPIGQWNGKRGFVLNSEYVNPEGVEVSNSMFNLEPNYGWRRVNPETPTITWQEATAPTFNYNEAILELTPRYNKFAEYYGYSTVPEDATIEEAETIIKRGLKQHNTFYRGLTMPDELEVAAIRSIIGNNATDREVMEYLARSGSRDPHNTYLSLDERANLYAKNGDVAILRRNYTLGENPRTWLEDADFVYDTTPATGVTKQGTINYPWAGSAIEKAPPGEVRLNPEDFTFEGWLPAREWEGGRYVPVSTYRGSKNLYFNEAAGHHKPSFAAGNATSLITDNVGIVGMSSANTGMDFSSPFGSDKFTQFLYKNKISGKPMMSTDAMEFVNGEFVPVKKEFADDVVKGLSTQAQEDLIRNTVERNILELKAAGADEATINQYRQKAQEAMNNVNVGRYSNEDYLKAGETDMGGFYDDSRNFISVNEGSGFPANFVEKHEGRHLIDYQVDLNLGKHNGEFVWGSDIDVDAAKAIEKQVHDYQEKLLSDAYDADFLNLPNTEFAGSLKGYKHMRNERVTTSRDARDVLLGDAYSKWEPAMQNKVIDKMSDEKVFNAVEKANGYGRRFIEFLRANNKLTPEKAQQFRESMKHVGGYAIPIGLGIYGAVNL